jgi:pimeloyl-ACP methyl ester carboxylesterase
MRFEPPSPGDVPRYRADPVHQPFSSLPPMPPPVVLVHGWGGSYAATWQATGFADLLAEAGRTVIGVDLLGHGTAPKPHDPVAYADLTARIVEATAVHDQPVDAVGFSLGALTLLQLACAQPERFHRLVLAGVGANVFRDDQEGTQRILAGLDGSAGEDDVHAHVFANYAAQPGNDAVALAALLRRPRAAPLTKEQLAAVDCPVLVVIGDADFAGPGDELVATLRQGSLRTLRNTDHFATPESFGFFDAALTFLDS